MIDQERIQNPFFNRHRITDPAFFYGRTRQIEALYSAIVTRQCRALVGERKLGKSSLLTTIGHPETMRRYGLDPQRQLVLYLDLESMSSAGVDDFWVEVLDVLSGRVPPSDLGSALRRAAEAGEVRFMAVRRLLRRVRDAGLDVALCLDEFEALARNPRFEPDFYGELRSLAGELGIVYITASKRSLYELTYEHSDTLSSPFFNIFSELPIGLMRDTTAHEMLTGLSSRCGQTFCKEEMALALSLGGTHPFFLQIAGYHLCDLPGRGGPRDAETVTRIRRRFLAEVEDHYRYLWSQLTATQQMALMHLDQASEPAIRVLRAKNLIVDQGEQPIPFNPTFAEFLARQLADQTTPIPLPSSGTTVTPSDLTGKTLGGYRVLAPIGQGGMADVYQGYHPALDRYVAIKILSPRLASDGNFAERFQREATAVARLRHPNIVQVYDFGAADNITYMVMEYIAGPSLKERLRRLREQNQRLPRDQVVAVVRDVAAALDYAHAHGLIHRDVKPANILLREAADTKLEISNLKFENEPYAVLTDFGVAKILEGVQLTAAGMTLGTPDYMSPEQAAGDEVTPASDIYALGVILFEMLTGQLPFSANTPLAVLFMHMSDPPPQARSLAPDISPQVEAVLERALSKSPSERFTSASDLADALEQALRD